MSTILNVFAQLFVVSAGDGVEQPNCTEETEISYDNIRGSATEYPFCLACSGAGCQQKSGSVQVSDSLDALAGGVSVVKSFYASKVGSNDGRRVDVG